MNKKKSISETWRDYLEKSFNITIPIVAIVAAFILSGVLIYVWGSNPFDAYLALFSGALGSPNAVATTLVRGTPLFFTGLAVAYGYRGGFFNVGADGQLYLGAYAAVWVGCTLSGLPGVILIPLCILASMVAGMIYAFIPGILRATRGINEVLTCLLLNYVALQFAEWVMRVDHYIPGVEKLADGTAPVWTWLNWIGIKDPVQPFPKSPFIPESAHLPSISSILLVIDQLLGEAGWFHEIITNPAYSRITLAPVIGILMAGVMFFIMFRTTIGYKSRAVGINPRAATSMGINIQQTIVTTAVISGALAGLAGGMEVLGNQYRIIPNFLVNAGFDGIPVALIGQLHPFGVVLSSAFFGALRAGANKMQVITAVPVAVVYVIQSLAILFAIAGTTFDVESTLKKRRLMRDRAATPSDAQTNPKEVSHA